MKLSSRDRRRWQFTLIFLNTSLAMTRVCLHLCLTNSSCLYFDFNFDHTHECTAVHPGCNEGNNTGDRRHFSDPEVTRGDTLWLPGLERATLVQLECQEHLSGSANTSRSRADKTTPRRSRHFLVIRVSIRVSMPLSLIICKFNLLFRAIARAGLAGCTRLSALRQMDHWAPVYPCVGGV